MCFFLCISDFTSRSDVKSDMSCVYQFFKFMAKFQESMLCRTEKTTEFPRFTTGQRASKAKIRKWTTTFDSTGGKGAVHRWWRTENLEKCSTQFHNATQFDKQFINRYRKLFYMKNFELIKSIRTKNTFRDLFEMHDDIKKIDSIII